MTPGTVARAFAVLLAYVAAVVWLTWPLGAHLATHFPSVSPVAEMDTLHSLWVLSWETHALTSTPAHFLDANIYHPAPHALLYGTMGLATLPYFAPTFLATGNPVLAANLALIACVALAAWGLHRIVVGWTGSSPAAVVAASTFLMTPWILWTWTPARPVHFALQYFPWIIALVALPGWSSRRGVVLGALVALQCLMDPLYVAPAVVAPIVTIALARTWRPDTRAAAFRLARTVALALLVLAPIYACYAAVRIENPSLLRQSAWASPDAAAAAPPMDGLILARGLYAALRPTGVPSIALLLLALGLLSRAIGPHDERRLRRAWLHAGLWVVVGLLIATPAVIWLGNPPVVVRSPIFMLGERLFPAALRSLRGTIRLSVGALMGLAALAGLAFAECERRLPRRSRAAACASALLLVAVMYAPWPGRTGPYPLKEAPAAHTAILDALRAGHGPVLELPASTGQFATTEHARAMYRSIFHWRPLLNGYGSYWPVGFPARMETAARLPDPEALAVLQRETGVESILVHPNDRRYAAWVAVASHDGGPLRLVAKDGDDLLFAVVE